MRDVDARLLRHADIGHRLAIGVDTDERARGATQGSRPAAAWATVMFPPQAVAVPGRYRVVPTVPPAGV